VLDDRYPALQRYLARLEARPAFQKADALSGMAGTVLR
jgi:glutathione S-transferase